ncbi:MAG: integrating conjugative element protein [Burkholderiales bacterium]|nr:integrating conjugative element protein [Burkholderiales bacterium]
MIHDGGAGVPIDHLLAQPMANEDGSAWSQVQYPVRTPGLRPGTLRGNPVWPDAQWLTQPVFLIGADAGSRYWLRKHRAALIQLGATGLLVDARSEGDNRAVQQDAGGLTVAPVAATWLATRLQQLGAPVLPLLIRADGVLTQQPGLAR